MDGHRRGMLRAQAGFKNRQSAPIAGSLNLCVDNAISSCRHGVSHAAAHQGFRRHRGVRQLAQARRLTLTEAVKVACEEALARDQAAQTGLRTARQYSSTLARGAKNRRKRRQGVLRSGMGRVRLLVETSALVAIALEEPGWEKLAEAIASAKSPVTTCINVFEAALALSRVRELAPTETHSLVERLVAALGVEVAGISPEMIALAALSAGKIRRRPIRAQLWRLPVLRRRAPLQGQTALRRQ